WEAPRGGLGKSRYLGPNRCRPSGPKNCLADARISASTGYSLEIAQLIGEEGLEPKAATLRCALLAGIVDIDQPESTAVPERPLEVVHQTPGEVAPQRQS